MSYTTILETQRLILAPPSDIDQSAFAATVEMSLDLLSPWVIPPCSQKNFNRYINKSRQDDQFSVFLRLKPNAEIIGVININEIVRGCFQSGYLGFYLLSGYEKQGYMSEALKAVIDYTFNELKLHRLEANIQPENINSIKLVKGLGFSEEGYSPKYLFIADKWRDHLRFAMLNKNSEG